MKPVVWRASVIAVIAATIVLGVGLCLVHMRRGYQRSSTEEGLEALSKYIVWEAINRKWVLPRGNARSLNEWFPEGSRVKSSYDAVCNGDSGTFRDAWGSEIIYRFPPRDKEAIFELYSCGPNGVDDGGGGDDIGSGDASRFSSIHLLFKRGKVDPDWFWSHVGDRLQTEQGLVIGDASQVVRKQE